MSSVDETSPPITEIPIEVLCFEASFSPIATGIIPAMSANEVMRIGRSRVFPDLIMASFKSTPC